MRKYFKLLAISALAVMLLATCGSKKGTSTNSTQCVEVISPTPLDTVATKNYTGRVKESEQINVAFKTGGQIKKINVRVGDHVAKGQLLANIDSSDYVLGLRNYEIQYHQLNSEVKRLKSLYEKRTVSENDYEKAAAGLEQLAIAVEGNRRRVAYTMLYAPASGVITDVFYSAGELVDAGMAVFSLLADHEMEVIFDLPVAEYQQRNNFSKIWCYTSLEPDKLLPMRILSITPKADNSQLYRVHLAFDTPSKNQLTAGMTISVKVEKEKQLQNGVTIPISSICKSETEPFVWVLTGDNHIRKQAVSLGNISENGQIVVTDGLKGNEMIVKVGTSSLQEGEHVRVLPQPSETNVGNLF